MTIGTDTEFVPYTRDELLRKRELYPEQQGVIDTALYWEQRHNNAEWLLRDLSSDVEEFLKSYKLIKKRS